MFSQEHYHNLLVQSRMDHSKFDDLEKGLTGKVIVDKLTEDFEILYKFLIIRGGCLKCLMKLTWSWRCQFKRWWNMIFKARSNGEL